jgi:hypothetical protein
MNLRVLGSFSELAKDDDQSILHDYDALHMKRAPLSLLSPVYPSCQQVLSHAIHDNSGLEISHSQLFDIHGTWTKCSHRSKMHGGHCILSRSH